MFRLILIIVLTLVFMIGTNLSVWGKPHTWALIWEIPWWCWIVLLVAVVLTIWEIQALKPK